MRVLSKENTGFGKQKIVILKLTGAGDSCIESLFYARREKKRSDYEIEILTYLDDVHCVLL